LAGKVRGVFPKPTLVKMGVSNNISMKDTRASFITNALD
jgi:hypothetical protein